MSGRKKLLTVNATNNNSDITAMETTTSASSIPERVSAPNYPQRTKDKNMRGFHQSPYRPYNQERGGPPPPTQYPGSFQRPPRPVQGNRGGRNQNIPQYGSNHNRNQNTPYWGPSYNQGWAPYPQDTSNMAQDITPDGVPHLVW